jgi:hypothetical protein
MMVETEEEALFARLRDRLAARRHDGPLLAGVDADLATAVARIEASIGARVEVAVARAMAGLRPELYQTATRPGRPRGRRPPAQRRRLATLLLALTLLGGVGTAAWLNGDAVRNGFAQWRTALHGWVG